MKPKKDTEVGQLFSLKKALNHKKGFRIPQTISKSVYKTIKS